MGSVGTESLPHLGEVVAEDGEGDCEEVDCHQLGDSRNVGKVVLRHHGQVIVLAADELNVTVAADSSADFDFHLNSAQRDLDDYANNFTIIEVDDVVLLEVPLDGIVADPEVLIIGVEVELATEHINGRATADANLSVFEVGHSDLAASALEHHSTRSVRAQALGGFVLADELKIIFDGAVAEVDTSGSHSSVDELDDIFDGGSGRPDGANDLCFAL
eukprot:CAMPEP_0170505562 /NCGR_PEP_ID=MMETSP0208-20121228/51329_1 /TAXON_ID=197538 /ORGANISM="Strombidium inclinatum, Strain S3" /LENGTH=216 /DNA_ID=CAMNT_0010786505 /DNA_START=821 /DNA_END=1471 /DNA_ORIENTATION=+